ncbi:MAG: Rieske (2Fe-2S) protein [Planctomycetota bacterium]|nr:Rieske (2Fe-2S) protein [Planctomycetota bacterium]
MLAAASKTRHEVAKVEELPSGSSKIIQAGRREIGVFNVNGTYRAVLNICPHELAPVCKGHVKGTNVPSQPGEYKWGLEGEVLQCPWHGWEFNLNDGKSLHEPHRCHLRTFETEVSEGMVYVLV